MSSEANEANRQEAKKALDIARRKLGESDVDGAIRFVKKSNALHETSTAKSLLAELETLKKQGFPKPTANGHATASASKSSNAVPKASSSAAEPSSEKKRDYTPEQAALVKQIRSCKITDYYEILSIQKDCEEIHIKKAYRKLALALHPDKNGAPGADEAFKLVGKAFQVLSDPQKRAIHDRHGADPDDRSSGMPSYSQTSFARNRGAGQTFGDEMSAEDLFNMFFGGMGAQTFGPGQGGIFGPNVRFQTFGGPQMRRPGGGQAQAQQPIWVQLLPLFLLIGFSLLTQLPSLFSTSPPPDPSFSFEKSSFHNLQRQTHTHAKVDYFVNARQYATHPLYQSLINSNIEKLAFQPTTEDRRSADYTMQIIDHAKSFESLPEPVTIPRDYLRFEQSVEQAFLQRLHSLCQLEINNRNDNLQRARGFFGLGADWDEVKRLEEMELKHCNKLRSLGYRIQT